METGLPMRGAEEWRLHWTVLLAAVAGVTLSTTHTYMQGVMIGPLERAFGWSRAEISAGPLIMAFIALVMGPGIGMAVDRFGPRRIALGGVVLFCGALASLSTAQANILSWWGLWVLMSIASLTIAPIVWTAAVTSRFVANRGLALAIALCGAGLGGFIVPTLGNELINQFGWRGAYVAMALIFAAIVLPLTLFFFRSAAETSALKDKIAQAALPGIPAHVAFRSLRYVKLAAAAILLAFAVCAVIANAVPILVSEGHDRTNAAHLAGLVGLGAIAGRLCGGYLLDRLDANRVAAVCVLAPIITSIILLQWPGSTEAATAAFLILGLAVGAELDACAYLVTRHFGLRSFGALFGVINGFLIAANGLAPFAANYVYDITKSYDFVLLALIPVCLASSFCFGTLGRYPVLEGAAEQAPSH